MDTQQYHTRIVDELGTIEDELRKLGVPDPQDPENWLVRAPELDVLPADENELADKAEEAHIDTIVLAELQQTYKLLLHARSKIEQHTFGVCEVCGTAIEPERLEASITARTCKAHVSLEETLTL